MRIALFSLLIFSSINYADYFDYIYKDRNPSYNSFGQVGLIQTPSAKTNGEDSIIFVLNTNDMWKFGTLTVTPFNWLEASYFYYRPNDLAWQSNQKRGDYLDKGFNVKFSYKPKKNLPTIALGLDDIGGTGYFAREYIVSTIEKESFNLTIGMGWGKFKNISSISNPLKYLNKKFETRRGASKDFKQGGNFSYDTWFRGDVSLFGGLEIYLPKTNGIKFKLEHDPFNYFDFSAQGRPDAEFELRRKDNNINIGFSIPINDFLSLEASYIKGNNFNTSLVLGKNFNRKRIKKSKYKPKVKETVDRTSGGFYKDLLFNLNNNKLYLQTAEISEDKKELKVAITDSTYLNAIRSSSYAADISNKTIHLHNLDIDKITISNINAGIEANKISYFSEHLSNKIIPIEVVKNYTKIDSGNKNSFKDYKFRPSLKFPIFFNETAPNIVSHVGSPDQFYFGGIVLQNTNELLFKRNLILSSRFVLNVANNFDETPDRPVSDLPHVRTDIVKYLQQSNKVYVEHMQMDYFFTPLKNTYAKISGGLFEKMYAGVGFEVLHNPFNRNFYVGLESFYVKKRDFNILFDFLNYETNTSHINFNYFYEPLGINLNLSFGKYLAEDKGYTFDLSRISKLGVRSGFFFTRTDVSAELFGEGSFDKGFYFQIPLEIFSKNYSSSYTNFKLRPLTRDGGQKLIFEKSLQGLINNSSAYELNRQWSGFLD